MREREKWDGRGIRKINCTLSTTQRTVHRYRQRHGGLGWVSTYTLENPGRRFV